MNIFRRSSSSESSDSEGSADFDMLRARVEVDVPRPAVVAITSSTAEDGAVIAARGLAQSLSGTGYPTLLIDASQAVDGRSKPITNLTLKEIVNQIGPAADSRHPVILKLCDAALQKNSSQRDMQSALELFRTKFDYVIMVAQHGLSTSFSTSIVAAADVVLVTIKTGRRQRAPDERVAETLKRLGIRFMGLIALSASVANGDSSSYRGSELGKISRRDPSVNLDNDLLLRDVAEFPT